MLSNCECAGDIGPRTPSTCPRSSRVRIVRICFTTTGLCIRLGGTAVGSTRAFQGEMVCEDTVTKNGPTQSYEMDGNIELIIAGPSGEVTIEATLN